MKVIQAFPPNFAAINAAFNVRGKRVLFAYGDRIYNPARFQVPPHLIVHEGVHGRRQGDDPDGWWRRYIAERAFRLAEEIPAHAAEYRSIGTPEALDRVAKRLSSPLYGSLISYDYAVTAVMGY